MKPVHFDAQTGEEWLEWRKKGLGASDISVILGSNPFKSTYTLWEEKSGFGEDVPSNAAIEHGVKNEPIARNWINSFNSFFLKPLCVEDEDLPFIRASLDGYDEHHNILVEIKCPVREEIIDRAAENGSLPAYWIDQIQWQIMIANPSHAYLAVWDYRIQRCHLIEVYGDPALHQRMREEAKDFWDSVISGKAPLAKEGDYIDINEPELHEKLLEYQGLSKKESSIKLAKKDIKDKIVGFGDDGNFKCAGFKVCRMPPRKTYDLEKMRIDGIDVEKYAKNQDGIGYYKIFCPKETS